MRIRRIIEYDDKGQVFYDKETEVNADTEMILYSEHRRFIKIFATSNLNFSSVKYLGYFHRLLKLLEKNTNRIIWHKKGENVALMRRDISEYLKISSVTVWRFLGECIRKGYITQAKMHSSREAFYVNPAYAMNGAGCYPETYLLFEGEKEIEKQINEKDRIKINEYLEVAKQ